MQNPYRKLKIRTFENGCGRMPEALHSPRQEVIFYRAEGNFACIDVHLEVIDATGQLWAGEAVLKLKMQRLPADVLAARVDLVRRRRRPVETDQAAAEDAGGSLADRD